MDLLIYFWVSAVRLFLTIEQLLFLARAILSWLFMAEDGAIPNFLHAMTEPLILPVRALLNRFEAIRDFPIDIAFLVTVMLMSVIQMLLPTVYL